MQILLLEENELLAANLVKLADKTPDIVLNRIDDISEIEDVKSVKQDAVLIDTVSKHYNPVEAAQSIKKRYREIAVVFYGVNDEFDLYDIEHVYYSRNIINEDNWNKTLQKIRDYVAATVFYFSSNRLYFRVRYDDILYFESEKRVCHLTDKTGKIYDFYKKLDLVAEEVGDSFFRCSKSFLLNKKYIRSVSRDTVVMENGEEFTITRKYAGGGR